MTLYTFECASCHHQWTQMTDDDKGEHLPCPVCGSPSKARVEPSAQQDSCSINTGFS